MTDVEREALAVLRSLEHDDPESAHSKADDILVKLLRHFGCDSRIIDSYHKVPEYFT